MLTIAALHAYGAVTGHASVVTGLNSTVNAVASMIFVCAVVEELVNVLLVGIASHSEDEAFVAFLAEQSRCRGAVHGGHRRVHEDSVEGSACCLRPGHLLDRI